MGQAFTPGLSALARTKILRRRELPLPGVLLKKIGDQVKASDCVARADLPGDLGLIRIPEQLGITAEEAMKGLKVKEGDRIGEGDVVCIHRGLFGLFKSVAKSDYSGTVELVSERTGHIGVRLASKPIEVQAYISGVVKSVEGSSALSIETEAGFVQGIFGIGGERQGKIKLLSIPASKTIAETDIPNDAAGTILVGGTRPSIAALKKAADLGVQAMVVGAIDDQTLEAYLGYDLGIALTGDENVPMSIIITEGFGELAISERILALFAKWNGLNASVNGATQVRAGAIRPEIIAEIGATTDAGTQHEPDKFLNVGSHIRIIRVPYFGLRAEVTELPIEAEKIETGATIRVLRAKLEDGNIVTVPRANVELV